MKELNISSAKGYLREILYYRKIYDSVRNTPDYIEKKSVIYDGLLDVILGLGDLTRDLKKKGQYTDEAVKEIDMVKNKAYLNLDKVS